MHVHVNCAHFIDFGVAAMFTLIYDNITDTKMFWAMRSLWRASDTWCIWWRWCSNHFYNYVFYNVLLLKPAFVQLINSTNCLCVGAGASNKPLGFLLTHSDSKCHRWAVCVCSAGQSTLKMSALGESPLDPATSESRKRKGSPCDTSGQR